jgi:hypothetical protein
MSDTLVAVRSALRALPLFVARAPRTPLRVLCVIALDVVHRQRHRAPMSRRNVGDLSAFLDFAACVNAEWDRKALRRADYAVLRTRFERSEKCAIVDDYLARIADLEGLRPGIGGSARHFEQVRSYREAVATVSLAAAAAIALDSKSVDAETRAIGPGGDLEGLLRIVMQCQIVDDVLDYAEDRLRGLPSFLTATASLTQALALTSDAARGYGAGRRDDKAVPIRAALSVATAAATLLVRIAQLMPVRGLTSRRLDRPCDDPSRRDTRRSPADPLSPTTHRTRVGAIADRA